MTEPDVALTDYALAIECAILCGLVARWAVTDRRAQSWWIVLFASIGLGSVLGGTVHGFFRDESSPGYALLWPATLLTLGVTSACMWMIGIRALRRDLPSWVSGVVVTLFLVYAAVVLLVSARFVVAIAAYLPAAVFLLATFIIVGRRNGRYARVGIVGIVLTFIAAAVQQMHIALHPVYFNHNALYHVIQGMALALLCVGARQLVEDSPPRAD